MAGTWQPSTLVAHTTADSLPMAYHPPLSRVRSQAQAPSRVFDPYPDFSPCVEPTGFSWWLFGFGMLGRERLPLRLRTNTSSGTKIKSGTMMALAFSYRYVAGFGYDSRARQTAEDFPIPQLAPFPSDSRPGIACEGPPPLSGSCNASLPSRKNAGKTLPED